MASGVFARFAAASHTKHEHAAAHQTAIQELRETLRFGHVNNRGLFDDDKTTENLSRLLLSSVLQAEAIAGKPLFIDNKDPIPGPYANWDGTTIERGYGLARDEGGHPIPWSISAHQARGEEVRRSEGKPWRVDPPGRLCGKIIRKGTKYFACKTCTVEPPLILCPECFQASDHEGHELVYVHAYSFGEMCACGTWTAAGKARGAKVGCKHHPPLPPKYVRFNDADPTAEVYNTLYSILSRGKGEPAQRHLFSLFQVLIDYILSVLEQAPLLSAWNKLPATREQLSKDEITHSIVPKRAWINGPWTVVLQNDDKHSFAEATRQFQVANNVPRANADRAIKALDDLGRINTMTTTNLVSAYYEADMYQQIDMWVILRHAFDAYRESTAGVLITFLADLCDCHMDGDPDMIPMILAAVMEQARPAHDRQVTPDVRFHHRSSTTDPPMRLDWLLLLDNRLWKRPKLEMRKIYARLYSVNAGVRDLLVDRFGRGYIRFAELSLTEERDSDSFIATSMISMLFAFAHPMTLLTAQRRRIPRGDSYDLLSDLVAATQSFFTHHLPHGSIALPVQDAARQIAFDHEKWETDVMLRGRKAIEFIHVLRSFMFQEPVQLKAMDDDGFFLHLVDLLGCFVGLGTQAHHTQDHVKYESEYHRAFTLMSELASLGRSVAETNLRFHRRYGLDEKRQVPILRMIKLIRRIDAITKLHTQVLDPAKYNPPELRPVKGVLLPDGDETLHMVPAWGMTGFSYHHQLHYMLGEMFKTVFVTEPSRPISIRQIFRTAQVNIQNDDTDNQILLTIDAPLTTFMVMGQVRAGMWARNGQAWRAQTNAYRDIAYREVCMDQEFVLLQVAMASLRPIQFITSVIDRYGMNQAFREAGQTYLLFLDWSEFTTDINMIIDLLEDMVWLIVALVSDVDNITAKRSDETCRKAIIQALAVNDLTWLEIHRRLPERSFGEVKYLDILNSVATSRRPIEQGTVLFSLKPEYYTEVDPVWRHYTRNERVTAQANILAHLRKTHPNEPKIFVRPLPLELPSWDSNKPLAALRGVLEGAVAQRLVHYLIGHCMKIGYGDLRTEEPLAPDASRSGQLLDATLWLATLAIDTDPVYFSKASVDPSMVSLDVQDKPTAFTETATPNTLFENLEKLQVDEKMWKDYINRIDYLIQKIVDNAPCALVDAYLRRHKMRQQADGAAGPPMTAAEKAAARQKELLAEFAKKQADFAALMIGEDDDDEDDDAMDEDKPDNDTAVNIKSDDSERADSNCIVCGDAVDSKRQGGMLGYFQPSRVLREWTLDKQIYERAMSTPCNLDDDTTKISNPGEPDQMGITDAYSQKQNRLGAYVSYCGHMMHEDCLGRYFETTRMRHTTQVNRNQPENVMRMEYLCPLCKTTSNHLVPREPSTAPLLPFKHHYVDGRPAPLMDRIRGVSQEHLRSISDSGKIWEYHEAAGQLSAWYADTSFSAESLDQTNRKTVMKPISRMMDRYRGLMRSLSDQSVGYRQPRTRPGMYMPDDVVGFTIACQEVALRGTPRVPDQQTVAEQMSSTSILAIKQMIRGLQLDLDLYFGPRYNRTTLRVALFCRLLPDYYRASPLTYPVLLRDPLSFAIEAAAIAPDLLHPVMVMAYLAEVTRVVISLSLFIRRSSGIWDTANSPIMQAALKDTEAFSPDALSVFDGFRPIMKVIISNTGAYGGGVDDSILNPISDEVLQKLMYMCTLPILRRLAMLYHSLSGEYPISDPAKIHPNGGSSEYHRLLQLLALPRPTEALGEADQKSTYFPIVMRWVSLWVAHGRQIATLEWPGLYQLIRLPRRMEDLVRHLEDKRCTSCKTLPTNPAMCLFCGRLLCLGGDCCSYGEQGECNIHMRECGGATGIYLDIRRWTLLLLFAGNGSFIPAPYNDQFGETDYRRNNNTRLYLNPKRLHELRRGIWLNHAVPHVIARKLEPSNDLGGWGTL